MPYVTPPPRRRIRGADAGLPLGSRPRVVARDRACHAAWSAAAANELAALEGDHGALAVGDPVLAREKTDGPDDPESHLLHLAKCRLVPAVCRHQAGSHCGEVAAGRPLLTLLHRASIATDEDWLE